MCNASIRDGHLPVSQKAALITPVLKKPALDPDDAKSYRPFSNLIFISKMIERLVANRLMIISKNVDCCRGFNRPIVGGTRLSLLS